MGAPHIKNIRGRSAFSESELPKPQKLEALAEEKQGVEYSAHALFALSLSINYFPLRGTEGPNHLTQ